MTSFERLSSPRSLLRLAILLLLAGLASAAIGWIFYPKLAPHQPEPELVRADYGPATYQAAIDATEIRIRTAQTRISVNPDSWAAQESLARALMARAHLNGSYDDLAVASATLATAQADAPEGAGPFLTQAAQSMTIHDLSGAADALVPFGKVAVPPSKSEQAEAHAIASDIAFYRGDYAAASKGYREAAAVENSASVAFRISYWQRKMGDLAGAEQTLDDADALQKGRTPQFLATLRLALGGVALDRGDWAGAEGEFAAADKVLPGYWLSKAHLAQMTALRGDYPGAERAYRAILATTPEPMVMDALAALYRAQGKIAEMRPLVAQASAIWTHRLKILPTAARGHAIEHLLVFGDPAQALTLAETDYAARPYGDSAMLLGLSLIKSGDPARAIAVLQPVVDRGWKTAMLDATLSQAYALAGNEAGSARAKADALALNPKAFDPASSLIWFGHH